MCHRFVKLSAILLLLLTLPRVGPAAEIGFPGLDVLTSSSAAIAVLRIVEEPTLITDCVANYGVIFESVLHDTTEGLAVGTTVPVTLYSMGAWNDSGGKESEIPPHLRIRCFSPYASERYLVFLLPGGDTYDGSRAGYRNYTATGSMIPLNRDVPIDAEVKATTGPLVQRVRQLIDRAGAPEGAVRTSFVPPYTPTGEDR